MERREIDSTEDITVVYSKEKMTITLFGKDYFCSVHFSMLDLKNFYEERDAGESGKIAIAEAIYKNLVDMDNPEQDVLEEIENLPDSVYEQYIEQVTERDPVMKQIYEEASGDCFCRFNEALRKSWEKQWQQMKPALAQAFKVNIPAIDKSLVQFSESISKLAAPIINTQKIFKPLADQMTSINKIISDSFGNLSKTLSALVSKIKVPSYTEEEKEEIKDAYLQWGKYGWSVIPNAPITLYFDKPADLKEANKTALKYCNNAEMQNLFDEIRNTTGVKKSDFEDAVFCFENKRYKPCAMMLFSLLDAKLIHMQKEEDRDKRHRRLSGNRAAEKIEKRLSPEVENSFYITLAYANLFQCINAVFQSGNDFVKQPEVINRNFLDHGMLTRNVKRMECVQLFLLFYNFMKMLEWMK